MSISEKVALTKEQFNLLDDKLNYYGMSPEEIIKGYFAPDDNMGITSIFVDEFPSLDILIRALYIGYEVEKAPEDKLKEYYDSLFPCREYSLNHEKAQAVRKTLELLEIDIKGVTSDEEF